MAFSSDTFKAIVGTEGSQCVVEIWTDGEAALIDITESGDSKAPNQVLMRLDRDDLMRVLGALQEALRQVTGDS